MLKVETVTGIALVHAKVAVVDENDKAVAWMGEHLSHDEQLRVATLITAAPDLLAACEGALECLEDEGYEDGGEHYIVTRLKAAIAKAKGGAT